MKHTTTQEILNYLIKNPVWISAFTSGEGSFTASVMVDVRAKWGIWPQCEFNITQLMTDEQLLTAINLFFNSKGGVYSRQNGVGTVSFRDLNALKTEIIPYFFKYPLLGIKGYEFERWTEIVELVITKGHLGDSLSSRDALVNILMALRNLNISNTRNNERKLNRNIIIVDWLNSLNVIPTKMEKLELLKLIKI